MKKATRSTRVRVIDNQEGIKAAVINFLKKKKNIVYGQRSINSQSKYLHRSTDDWDAYSKNPKSDAHKLQAKLDKIAAADYYYSKEAKHKGTFKVKGLGNDLVPSADDESIADFSKPEGKIQTVKKDGVRYRHLKQEIAAKQRSLADPTQKFRHEKDKGDLDRTLADIKINKLLGGSLF